MFAIHDSKKHPPIPKRVIKKNGVVLKVRSSADLRCFYQIRETPPLKILQFERHIYMRNDDKKPP